MWKRGFIKAHTRSQINMWGVSPIDNQSTSRWMIHTGYVQHILTLDLIATMTRFIKGKHNASNQTFLMLIEEFTIVILIKLRRWEEKNKWHWRRLERGWLCEIDMIRVVWEVALAFVTVSLVLRACRGWEPLCYW